jgi:glycerophosphoryl diester phosphodiesterase
MPGEDNEPLTDLPPANNDRAASGQVEGGPIVVAHRGAWGGGGVPENTPAAFERAINLGADMIEFDVRRTRDRELIIFHDAELAGTPVANLTRPEIEDLAGVLPPLLEEALELAADRIALDVELKEDSYVEEVVELLAAFAARGRELIVTSFIDRVLVRLAELTPQIKRGLLLSGFTERAPERAHACGATAVLPEMQLVDEASVAVISNAGFDLIVWDFMASEHAALLSDPRISGVITDDVPGALAARDLLRTA